MKKDVIKKWFFLLLLIGVSIEMTSQNDKKNNLQIGGLGNPCPVGVDCEGNFFNPRLVVKKKVTPSVDQVDKPEQIVTSKKVPVQKPEDKAPIKVNKTPKPSKQEEVVLVEKIIPVKKKKTVSKSVEVEKKNKLEGPPDGWDAPPTGLGFDEQQVEYNSNVLPAYNLPVNNLGILNSGSGVSRANYSR
ncbi:hypothetical protein [Aquimarina agarilytica]|uniref:hypothetical protein n=1 Tax=Aquimarina agarilytica TaxID=1087449 RepID=UPI00028923FC|nr:hypothetical protein [Aquimarina agarilytica]